MRYDLDVLGPPLAVFIGYLILRVLGWKYLGLFMGLIPEVGFTLMVVYVCAMWVAKRGLEEPDDKEDK